MGISVMSLNPQVIYVSATTPADKTKGKLWYNTTDNSLYVSDGSQYNLIVQDTENLQQMIQENALNILINSAASSTILNDWDYMILDRFISAEGQLLTIDTTNTTAYFISNKYKNGKEWDISTASYDSKSLSVSSQDITPRGIFAKSDGTKVYMIGQYNIKIYQYSLSTAWDISTASYDNKAFYVGNEDTQPTGLFFKPDGTKVYIVGDNTNKVYQYSLSTAWDISTASYDSKSLSVSSQDGIPTDLFFKSDGTKVYVIGDSKNRISQYSLSTAWDISTANYDNKAFYVSQDSTPTGLFFKPDGTKVYVVGDNTNKIHQYSLSTAWDISTASYDGERFHIGEDNYIHGIAMKSEGTKFFLVGAGNDKIYQYSLSQATPSDKIVQTTSQTINSGVKYVQIYSNYLTSGTGSIDADISLDNGSTWTTGISLNTKTAITSSDGTNLIMKLNLNGSGSGNTVEAKDYAIMLFY